MAATADFWHDWISRGEFPDHPWRNYLQRSALTLKGLIYAPTGALLAAATSSLPETPGGERNYDYRYSWLRDSAFMLWGLYTLGFDREANDFFYFLSDLAEWEADLQIMYGIGGERDLSEHELGPPVGLRGCPPGADRQWRLGPAPARRVGRPARLRVPAHAVTRPPRRAPVANGPAAGGGRAGALAGARSGTLGGARPRATLHRLQDACAGWPRTAAPSWPGCAATGELAQVAAGGGRDPRRRLRPRHR